jgi:hypothetical protein
MGHVTAGLSLSPKVGPASAKKLLWRVGNCYRETRELTRVDELLNTSQWLVLQAKQAQSWQNFWYNVNGDVFERITDMRRQPSRNPQCLHSGKLAEEFQPFAMVHIVLPTWLQVVRADGEMAHIGENSRGLTEHLGQLRNLPI